MGRPHDARHRVDRFQTHGSRPSGGGPLGVDWIHGSVSAKHDSDPDIQVYRYDEHTVILRQNMAINYEAPFMFLLFGGACAVLIDTGATASSEFFLLRTVIDQLVTTWLGRHPRNDYPPLVLQSHSHHDHIAGDGQFTGQDVTSTPSSSSTTRAPDSISTARATPQAIPLPASSASSVSLAQCRIACGPTPSRLPTTNMWSSQRHAKQPGQSSSTRPAGMILPCPKDAAAHLKSGGAVNPRLRGSGPAAPFGSTLAPSGCLGSRPSYGPPD
jgi:hypothetical protein